jgi:hypothetical protein
MIYKRVVAILILGLFLVGPAVAQDVDSVSPRIDTLVVPVQNNAGLSLGMRIQRWSPPKKAIIASLVLPGSGQVLNRKWWKLPLVAGGFITGGVVIAFNRREYVYYRDVLYQRVVNNFDPLNRPDVSDALVRQVRDNYGRQYQTSVLLTGLFYLIVAADAFVDAHLSTFDVSENLSLHLTPATTHPGIGLSLHYHKKAEPLRVLP